MLYRMEQVVPVVLLLGMLVSAALFRLLPARDALRFALVGGCVILPVAVYPASVFDEPYGRAGAAHALVIPTSILWNRGLALGLGCLAGAILFHWPALRTVRLRWVDAPIVAWCLVPLVSTQVNGLPLSLGLSQTRYLILTWGVPYLLGRAFLADSDSLRRLSLAFVVVGLASIPFVTLEFVISPWLYGGIYGRHPYQFEGMERLIGFRPLLLAEHGNQLGMMVVSSAVAAVWLWRAGRLPSWWGVAAWIWATALVAVAALAQSLGAILLGAVALAPLLWTSSPHAHGSGWPGRGDDRRALVRAVAVMLTVGMLATIGLGVVAARDAGARSRVRSFFASVGKTSFTWRMARIEDSAERIAARPVLGWGQPDWSSNRFRNPVNLSLWLLAAGMYGAVGVVALAALVGVPVVNTVRLLPPSSWSTPAGSAVVLMAVLVLINALDALSNSTWLIPLTAGIGGLNGWSLRRVESR
ncbi:MAG: hypothetical protein U0794_22040 [Isosphaeraceae bacterium]